MFSVPPAPIILPRLLRVLLQTLGFLLGVFLLSSARLLDEALGVAPDELFHATVMPCFDKKLEASRADFSITSKSSALDTMSFTTQETDCVLTTGEVAQLIADAAEASGGVADRSAFGADAAARGRAPRCAYMRRRRRRTRSRR